ncbi:MAG: family 16 glycosylhydrolase [Spirochaetes bacterium]|nr:family 16 glycosylhydrolase [Spirochaetota bacterium]
MRLLLLFITTGFILFAGERSAYIPQEYKLIWNDEFSGTSVNTNAWNYRIGKAKLSVCDASAVTVANGAMKISLTENNGVYSGGGLITKKKYTQGFFEVAAKMDAGPGWHEAFWTSWADSTEAVFNPELKKKPRIEIDCFEHYGAYDGFKFTYGTIQWYPLQGNINRDYHTTDDDLSAAFHTYGFEVNDDFIAYYFDGKLLKAVDIRGVGQTGFHLWLTTIATMSNAQAKHGAAYFDYLRCYELEASAYPARKKAVLDRIAAETGGASRSAGLDLWIEAEDFIDKGAWTVERESGAAVLRGQQKKDPKKTEAELTARTAIDVMTAGKYRLWVRARDFIKNGQGTRTFNVGINGRRSETTFGTHGVDGYAWQDGGVYDIPAGMTTISLIDSSQFYARCDKMLLTTDPAFTPNGIGGQRNVEHKEGWK